jgi:hypothetical protein
MTTGSDAFKQPCKPNCLSPFPLHIHLPPLDRPPCPPTHPSWQHCTNVIRNQPRTAHEGSGQALLPCNPGQTPFPTTLLRPSMPLLGLAAKPCACTDTGVYITDSRHSGAQEQVRVSGVAPAQPSLQAHMTQALRAPESWNTLPLTRSPVPSGMPKRQQTLGQACHGLIVSHSTPNAAGEEVTFPDQV